MIVLLRAYTVTGTALGTLAQPMDVTTRRLHTKVFVFMMVEAVSVQCKNISKAKAAPPLYGGIVGVPIMHV
jgi:hypothetical protein